MKHIAVFASGNGSNFEAIVTACLENRIQNTQVSILVVDHKDIYAIERAKRLGIPCQVFLLKEYESKEAYEKAIIDALHQYDIDLICLAGYMKIVSQTLLSEYRNKIINIHPALLPSFKGAHGIEDAFRYGCKVFGVTIHYVSEELDGGKIIAQKAIEYYGNDVDELETEIHKIEHILYPVTINHLLNGGTQK